jgi:hypothetical protein
VLFSPLFLDRYHVGNLVLAVEIALDTGSRLEILEQIGRQATILHGFLAAKMIVAVLKAAEILQHENVAVVLHLAIVILEPAKIETYIRFFFHGMYLHNPGI